MNPWRRVPPHRSVGVYTEHGLSPGLVESFLDAAVEAGCGLVYDPFVGSGVVAVAAQDRCIPSIGVDANPWSLTLTAAKTRPLDWGGVLEWAGRIGGEAPSAEPLVPSGRLRRYHEPPVLEALARIRGLIEEAPAAWRPLLLAVLARVAGEASLLRRSPAPRLRRRAPRGRGPGWVYERFTRLLREAVADLSARSYCAPVLLVHADSTAWAPARVCGLLTSPPFANNIDYVRHTMLELLWAGHAADSRQLGALRSMQAPACEAAARHWKPQASHPWLRELASRIRGKRAPGYRRFLLQYFKAMEDHLRLVAETLEWEAWYTIGDSILGGAYIPTHQAIARLAEQHGLKAQVKPIAPRHRPQRTLYLIRLKPHR